MNLPANMKGMEFASNGNRQKVSGNDNLNLQQGNRVCFAKSYWLNGTSDN